MWGTGDKKILLGDYSAIVPMNYGIFLEIIPAYSVGKCEVIKKGGHRGQSGSCSIVCLDRAGPLRREK